ncbi:hypothetical protein BGZ63DRAFT_398154 [Mariannaea sp. PMI_226]|nr:hypothetical protein BGZ63DRAFT_398154 [Mariannaea sp. PMI_226]
MATHGPSNSLLGLEDPNLSFIDDRLSVESNPSSFSRPQTTQQQQYDDAVAVWQSTGKPFFDLYGPSSTDPLSQTSYLTSSCDLTVGQDQQQNLLPVSAGHDGLAFTTFSPDSIYTDLVLSNSNPILLAGHDNFRDTASLQPRVLSSLTHALREKPRSMASMAKPRSLNYNSPTSSSSRNSATSEAKMGIPPSSPDPDEMSLKASRKRKYRTDPGGAEDERDQPVKKITHTMAEKRYRTNLNSKMATLTDCIPSLRIKSKIGRDEDVTQDLEKLDGLTPALKLNKATVLSKATEYIWQLEKRVKQLLDENDAMEARIAAFEKLLMAGAFNEPAGLSNRFLPRSSIARDS